MKHTSYLILVICLLAFNCTEEIPLETKIDFDEALVIEGTITDELKQQTIKLSKSYRLESNEPVPVSNATVTVIDNIGNIYSFNEVELGNYASDIPFSAQANINYTLEVINEGISYSSNQVSFSGSTQIDDLYIERGFIEEQEGVSIFVDTFDPENDSNYYRYIYEETYKIIVPKYSGQKLKIINDDLPVPGSQFASIQEIQDYFVDLVPREEQVRVCYKTDYSNTIILTNANNFSEGRLEKFRVRFINRENYIMSHRYSILVRQYVQSKEAYNFYKTLKDFSISEGLLSENQLGFLEGNLYVNSNESNKKVIGYFEVSPTDSKRVYFNYADEFPDEDLPPYFTLCGDIIPALYRADPITGEIFDSPLVNALKNGLQYYTENTGNNPMFIGPGYPFSLVIEPCGDCTAIGRTEIPDFWED